MPHPDMSPEVRNLLLDSTLATGGATILKPYGLACIPPVGYVAAIAGTGFDIGCLDPVLWAGAIAILLWGPVC